MSATYRRHPRTAARRSDQETCACGPSEPTPPPRSMRLTLSGVASGHSPTTTGHPEPHTSARPHRPPYDSTPILIDRVRRKRQRLRSNGSIESDSAIYHPLSADTPARRVTPDRVITSVRTYSQHWSTCTHVRNAVSSRSRRYYWRTTAHGQPRKRPTFARDDAECLV